MMQIENHEFLKKLQDAVAEAVFHIYRDMSQKQPGLSFRYRTENCRFRLLSESGDPVKVISSDRMRDYTTDLAQESPDACIEKIRELLNQGQEDDTSLIMSFSLDISTKCNSLVKVEVLLSQGPEDELTGEAFLR